MKLFSCCTRKLYIWSLPNLWNINLRKVKRFHGRFAAVVSAFHRKLLLKLFPLNDGKLQNITQKSSQFAIFFCKMGSNFRGKSSLLLELLKNIHFFQYIQLPAIPWIICYLQELTRYFEVFLQDAWKFSCKIHVSFFARPCNIMHHSCCKRRIL